jgi:hypothetical protein
MAVNAPADDAQERMRALREARSSAWARRLDAAVTGA